MVSEILVCPKSTLEYALHEKSSMYIALHLLNIAKVEYFIQYKFICKFSTILSVSQQLCQFAIISGSTSAMGPDFTHKKGN